MFFSKQFNTVEINNSFYRLPSETAYQNWRAQVPSGFVFSVKASRFLTHIKRLKDPDGPLDLFFSRTRHLRERLGPSITTVAGTPFGMPTTFSRRCSTSAPINERGRDIQPNHVTLGDRCEIVRQKSGKRLRGP